MNSPANNTISRRGLMLVLSSPSGAGKSTLARLLLENDEHIEMSVSVTTRPPRPGEVDGRDYIFIARDHFEAMRAKGELLESARVFDNSYGTPRAPVEGKLEQGRDVLFDIDWQGAQQLHAAARGDLVTIFILPPSAGELETRLNKRAQDPPEVVQRRMQGAAREIEHWAEYQYVIVNEDIDRSIAAVRAILEAERLRLERQAGLSDFVKELQKGL